MRKSSIVMVATLVPLAAPAADKVENVLVHQTQQMFDAVASGNAKIWEKYLATGAIYVDETGAVDSRADIIKQITPLPKGISGTIKIEALAFHQNGDVAVLVHRDFETEHYFGQTLHAEYLSMDSWQNTGNGWRLVGEQVLATLKEPPAVALPPAKLDAYVGIFKLKNGNLTYTVTRRGSKLAGERQGKPPSELLAEAPDVFFVKGQPRIRKIFQRDGSGRVTGFVDRREGRDVIWEKAR